MKNMNESTLIIWRMIAGLLTALSFVGILGAYGEAVEIILLSILSFSVFGALLFAPDIAQLENNN